jgi:hypothetical protein
MPEPTSANWVPDWAVKTAEFVGVLITSAGAAISHKNAREAKEANSLTTLRQRLDVTELNIEDFARRLTRLELSSVRDRREVMDALAEMRREIIDAIAQIRDNAK